MKNERQQRLDEFFEKTKQIEEDNEAKVKIIYERAGIKKQVYIREKKK